MRYRIVAIRLCLLFLLSTTLVSVIWKSSYFHSVQREIYSTKEELPQRYTKTRLSYDLHPNATHFITEISKNTLQSHDAKHVLRNISKDDVIGALRGERIIPELPNEQGTPLSRKEVCNLRISGLNEATASSSENFQRTQTKKTNVVFVKVHKAASTTIQNIFLRFAFWNQLNVMLHKEKLHLNEHHRLFPTKQLVDLPDGEKFNILCHHSIFNKTVLEPFFPNDTLFIGIVREPFDRFVSAFKYYASVWKDSRILNTLRISSNPLRVCINRSSICEPMKSRDSSQLYYRLIRDFGFPLNSLRHRNGLFPEKEIDDFISNARANFDLVMVVEKFDESLLFLRRLLGWDLKDILYVKLNRNSNDKNKTIMKNDSKRKISDTTKATRTEEAIQKLISKSLKKEDMGKLRTLFSKTYGSEVKFYNAFLASFNARLKQQDVGFLEELLFFRQTRKKVEDFCNVNSPHELLTIPANKWTVGFHLSNMDCFLMNLGEISFTNLTRHVQEMRFKTLATYGGS